MPKECPYCGDLLNEIEARNSLSRWLSGTYICNNCGDFEAFVDLHREGHKLVFTGTMYTIGVVIENRPGYIPLGGDRGRLIPYEDACHRAKELNSLLREPVDEREELRVAATSLRVHHQGF